MLLLWQYGHTKNSCSSFLVDRSIQGEKEDLSVTMDKGTDPALADDTFGLWMVVQ